MRKKKLKKLNQVWLLLFFVIVGVLEKINTLTGKLILRTAVIFIILYGFSLGKENLSFVALLLGRTPWRSYLFKGILFTRKSFYTLPNMQGYFIINKFRKGINPHPIIVD
jgi:hypothetical protein